jgi:superfamily II DNA/RNA helicase
MMTVEQVVDRLLTFELRIQAIRLQFIEGDVHEKLDRDSLMEALSLLNELSLQKDEYSQKQLIAITALLWHYKDPEWDGLHNHLILFLSRAGFGPSSIMLDKGYSHEEQVYSVSTSIMNRYAIGIAQARNEIYVGKEKFLLTDFQKGLWNNLDSGPLIGISAPTSAGKSFLILLKAIDLLLRKKGTIVYIVPTLSLVNQVVGDFRKMLDRFELDSYSLETTMNPASYTETSVYVLTQEKAIAAFSEDDIPFKNVRLLVVDEIQNVERVASHDEMRAKVLYDLMVEFRDSVEVDHVIVSGPRIVKIDELSTAIFGITAIKKETTSSPVLSLTYSVHKKGENYFLKLFCDLLEKPLEVRITEKDIIKGYGKSLYDEGYLSYIKEVISGMEDECVLIFSPTTDACGQISAYMGRVIADQNNEFLDDLAGFIADTVHPEYGLAKVVKKGVVYHHSKLPAHVRRVVEHAVKDGKIKIIIATTTLLQGVNLPVQNIIIRNPNLFVRKKANSARLSNYELANLRGRAGRLLKDFVGRTFIMDEASFQEQGQQLDLFKDTEKELQVGYGRKYMAFKKDISDDLRSGNGSTADNAEYSYVTTYIRQKVMRHGIRSQVALSRVGINLTDKELNAVQSGMRGITIDRNLCARNRYWDPVDLDRMQRLTLPVPLPTRPGGFDNARHLKDILLFMQDYFPAYYDKYFGIKQSGQGDLLFSICILADQWASERPIKEILSTPFYRNADNIDKGIENMEKVIAFKMTMLLKPLYDIKSNDSMYPRFIELGAYKPLTRRLIELNIPRDTAIYLNGQLQGARFENKDVLVAEIRRRRATLPYWYRIQLDNI